MESSSIDGQVTSRVYICLDRRIAVFDSKGITIQDRYSCGSNANVKGTNDAPDLKLKRNNCTRRYD
ncbi:hypothetical protein BDZ89DRAFT_1068602 [Hymenopellis radicata]|nr:hypothetical protein BDZ89DRAFT_1068602 [Hymenopellis radicata]